MHRRRYRILIIEDNDDDRFLLERAFRRALGDKGTVFSVSDGEAAIAYLSGEREYADRTKYPFPSFIVTDLKMPRVDGFSVLEFLSANPAWNIIPRVVLTSSCDDDDIKTAYVVGASAFHCKPDSHEALKRCADSLVSYWSSVELAPMDETGRLRKTDHRGKLGERYILPEGGEHMQRPAPQRERS